MDETLMIAGFIVVFVVIFTVLILLKVHNKKLIDEIKSLSQSKTEKKTKKKRGAGGYVSVSSLEPGEILAEDVKDVQGKVVLLEAGTALNQKQINKLLTWGIKGVYVK